MTELVKSETYQNLGYYLQLLYCIKHYHKANIENIEAEFPGTEIQTLETDKFFIKFGYVDAKVMVALADLIQDNLVDCYIEAKPSSSQKDTQGKNFWYLNQEGLKVSLEKKTIALKLSLTVPAFYYLELFKTLNEKITDELRWENSFANSTDVLAQLADEALLEYREGRTEVLDPDNL